MAQQPTKTPEARANQMKDLINDGVALQIELLGAAVQVWSTLFESMAAFTKATSEEVLGLSSRGDANAALDNVMDTARKKLDTLVGLPEKIGRDFERKVKQRARTKP